MTRKEYENTGRHYSARSDQTKRFCIATEQKLSPKTRRGFGQSEENFMFNIEIIMFANKIDAFTVPNEKVENKFCSQR